MPKRKIQLLTVLLILGISVTACIHIGPPESCGDTIGGTADEVLFACRFERMALVNATSGEPGEKGEYGERYTLGDTLDLRADSYSEVAVRICIQNTSAGPIAYDQTLTFPEGSGGVTLGSFEPGNYVIRVIVDGILVRNFPFEIR